MLYWTVDYSTKVLGVEKAKVFVYINVTTITSPSLGNLMIAWIIGEIGDFENRRALLIITILSFLSFLSGIGIPFTNNFVAFGLALWFVIFFGTSILPTLDGIVLTSVKKELRKTANSASFLLVYLVGYIPAPLTYGFIYDMTQEHIPSFAYGYLVFFILVGVALLICSTLNKFKKGLLSKDEKEVIKEIDPIGMDFKEIRIKHVDLPRRRINTDNIHLQKIKDNKTNDYCLLKVFENSLSKNIDKPDEVKNVITEPVIFNRLHNEKE